MIRNFSLAAFILVSSVNLPVAAEYDQQTNSYLEGIWILDVVPDGGPCVSHWYTETQLEFEFRKTGGRLLIYEPYDLFTAIAIPEMSLEGDAISISALTRDGR